MHMKKNRTDASVYHQLFMEIRVSYYDYIPVYTDGAVAKSPANGLVGIGFASRYRLQPK